MYGMYITHGNGGGKFVGASLNNLEKLSMSVMADIYVMGHVHKRSAYKHSYRHIDMYHNVVSERDRLFVTSSHWQHFGGYAATKLLQPSAKGAVPIVLYSERKHFEAII
jgi:hypothetical protein